MQGKEVTLLEILEAREQRAQHQQELLARFGTPLICFTMNIPGPVKRTPLICRGFRAGCESLQKALEEHRIPILHQEAAEAHTGCTAYLCADASPEQVKTVTTAIEDATPLGRLFDMDVLTPDGKKLDREVVNGKSRDCIVCGAPGRGCASRRLHTVEQLQNATESLLRGHFALADAEKIAALSVDSLLEEVCTTPKPGLVDLRNNGSHRDMDADTFVRSAHALRDYFFRCVRLGQENAENPPEALFPLLRQAGLQAEKAMYTATGGINTHKGAIYTMGLLCGAAGQLWNPEGGGFSAEALCRGCAKLAQVSMAADFNTTQRDTAGLRLYHQKGLTGIRGEAAAGLPSVLQIALPVLQYAQSCGHDRNDAGVLTLLHLIAKVEDTNLYHRGGEAGAAFAKESAAALLMQSPFPAKKQIEELDDAFIARNLSPGGCADLLAATYFVEQLTHL